MSKPSPWAVPSSESTPKPSFFDIIAEQEASRVADGSDIQTGEIISMQEYLANFNKDNGTYSAPKVGETEDEDILLAQAIQKIETEDYLVTQAQKESVNSEPNTKVTVQHQEYHEGSARMPRAVSSQWHDAVAVENQVLQKSSNETKQFYKHDPLLQGISNASSLSELEGVGDLVNSGILIGDNVANSLKVSIKQNQDRDKDKDRKKG